MKLLGACLLLCIVPPCLSQSESQVLVTRTVPLIPSAVPTDPSWRHNRARQSKHVHDFFKLYGWLPGNDTIADSDMPRAIRKIQKVLREPETGVYDEGMETVMSRPRCGFVQPYNETDALASDSDIQKRYVLWGAKWDHTTITWRFTNYTADVASDRQRTRVTAAFTQWNQLVPVSLITASSTDARPDIHIRFIPLGPSKDDYGTTQMLSNGAALRSGSINITFNDDYNWSNDRLYDYTAVHEIGHALGLSHSKVPDAVMFPYFGGTIRDLHPDDKAAIHSVYGWKSPRWSTIDANTGTKSIAQISSAVTSTLDGLYQLRANGQVLFYSSSGSWTSLDNNKDTVQIAGSAGNLYQRHADGSVYRYTGRGTDWQIISYASDTVADIVAASDAVYQRRKDGWIAQWSGSGTTWNRINEPRSSKQIAVTDDKTIWNVLTTGDLIYSDWPYSKGWGWVDDNPWNTAIAVGGNEFYKLQSDGLVVWLNSVEVRWDVIENAKAVSISAAGKYIYSRHADGSTWRYTGTPEIWEQLDPGPNTISVIGDNKGAVWQMMGSGDILKLVS